MSDSKVLVVEDDKFLSKALKEKLSYENVDVFTAKSGTEALDIVKKHNPKLILLDIMMPHMNGFEFLSNLKTEKDSIDIPVIVLSNLSQESDRDKALELGAKEFFVKSDTPIGDVAEKVKSYLSQ